MREKWREREREREKRRRRRRGAFWLWLFRLQSQTAIKVTRSNAQDLDQVQSVYIECAIYTRLRLCAVKACAVRGGGHSPVQAGKAARGEGRRRREQASKQRQLRHTSDCSNHSSFIILSADLLPRPASTALCSSPSPLPSPSHCLPWLTRNWFLFRFILLPLFLFCCQMPIALQLITHP